MNRQTVQSIVLHDLKVKQSLEEATRNFPESLCLDRRFLVELNRFKEIQKNPQSLLQALKEIEQRKREQDDETTVDSVKENYSSVLCHMCGILLRKESLNDHLKVQRGYMKCETESRNSVLSCKEHSMVHQAIRSTAQTHSSERNQYSGKVKKSFICKVCGKVYLLRSTLLEHLKTHTDERNDRCGFKRFRQKIAFSHHRKRCYHVAVFPNFK